MRAARLLGEKIIQRTIRRRRSTIAGENARSWQVDHLSRHFRGESAHSSVARFACRPRFQSRGISPRRFRTTARPSFAARCQQAVRGSPFHRSRATVSSSHPASGAHQRQPRHQPIRDYAPSAAKRPRHAFGGRSSALFLSSPRVRLPCDAPLRCSSIACFRSGRSASACQRATICARLFVITEPDDARYRLDRVG